MARGTATISDLAAVDRIQREDHDRLIRLEAKVDNLITIAGDNNNRTALIDGRVMSLERLRDEINVPVFVAKVDELYEWKKQSQFMQKVFLTGAGLIGAAVSSIIYFILTFYQVYHQAKP